MSKELGHVQGAENQRQRRNFKEARGKIILRRKNKNYIPLLLEAYNLEGSEMKYLKC